MPDFRGENKFVLQPGDSNVPFRFKFEPCSAEDVNDGSLPYNTSIASVVVTAFDSDGTDVTSTMIANTPSVLNDIVYFRVNYPGAAGRYTVEIVATLDDGADKEFNFNRFVAKDL
jgi:hypothetical protein